nr:chromate transporter [Betaproteobacteria bacterium]
MSPDTDSHQTQNAPRSSAELFWVFAQLSLAGFGGVLPIAEDRLVRKEGWISAQDFLATLALAQVLPGPNICNMAVTRAADMPSMHPSTTCAMRLNSVLSIATS